MRLNKKGNLVVIVIEQDSAKIQVILKKKYEYLFYLTYQFFTTESGVGIKDNANHLLSALFIFRNGLLMLLKIY